MAKLKKDHTSQADAPSAWWVRGAMAIIVLLGLAAYWNSLHDVMVFDDDYIILANPTIHNLWPISDVLSPPRTGTPVDGRPVLNLTLAVNFAIGKLDPFGYHVFNIAIHILAALTLFGIIRRTLIIINSPAYQLAHAPRPGEDLEKYGHARFTQLAAWIPPPSQHAPIQPTLFALAAAAIWIVHPLQTESVTYISQRAESMVALLYLLTLYCAIRGFTAPAGEGGLFKNPAPLWYAAAIAASLVGMGAKEVMVSAPIMVLLYDCLFVAGSFKNALRVRSNLYAGLAMTWAVLLYLVLSTGTRGGTAGFGASDTVTCLEYARTQFGVILHYLKLCFWPHPLCIDYRWPVSNAVMEILPGALVVGLLFAATVWSLVKRSPLAILGAAFFMILAPSSSIVPIKDIAFEHRMYLPLASVIILAALAANRAWNKFAPKKNLAATTVTAALVLAVVGAFGYLTIQRNYDYRSKRATWQDVVNKVPTNDRAHYDLANGLAEEGLKEESIVEYRRAIELNPNYADIHYNLANVLASMNRNEEAIAEYHAAIKIVPLYAAAWGNLGNTLLSMGRVDEAVAYLAKAVEILPESGKMRCNLANGLSTQGRVAESMVQYQEALRLQPSLAEAHYNLGIAYQSLNQNDQAMEQYRLAIEYRPTLSQAHNNLANLLIARGDIRGAIEHYQAALALNPNSQEARINLARAMERLK